jgi:hypothetical protein
MDRLVEEVVIRGRTVKLTHEDVALDRIVLDTENPRIRYRLSLQQNGHSLDEVIQSMPEVKLLRRDIETNGGLRERVILQENGDNHLKAVEGNCRVVCLQSLHAADSKDPRWKTVPARILPKDIDPKEVAILLSDFHVAGKIKWEAHEKAGQVYHMVNALGMSQEDVALHMRTSKATVNRFLAAYGLMMDRFLKIDNEKYAKDGRRKWSYFEEFYKQKYLREELKANPDLGDDFCRWVGEGRFMPVEVRKLPLVLKNPEARKKLEKGGPFAEALKLAASGEPEQGSDFFKLLAKVRESCTNAAQIKDVLRIREDKVAKQRMIDTYNALVGFMKLAEVEPPK